jgi:hypothetical protein
MKRCMLGGRGADVDVDVNVDSDPSVAGNGGDDRGAAAEGAEGTEAVRFEEAVVDPAFAEELQTLLLYLRRLKTIERCQHQRSEEVIANSAAASASAFSAVDNAYHLYARFRTSELLATVRQLARSGELDMLRVVIEDWGGSVALPLRIDDGDNANVGGDDGDDSKSEEQELDLRLELLQSISLLCAPSRYAWLLPRAKRGAAKEGSDSAIAEELALWYSSRARKIEEETGNQIGRAHV